MHVCGDGVGGTFVVGGLEQEAAFFPRGIRAVSAGWNLVCMVGHAASLPRFS
jgi:hypothetical protein